MRPRQAPEPPVPRLPLHADAMALALGYRTMHQLRGGVLMTDAIKTYTHGKGHDDNAWIVYLICFLLALSLLGFLVHIDHPIGGTFVTKDCYGNISYGEITSPDMHWDCMYGTTICNVQWYGVCLT
jgi:hypothetical protein